MMPCRWISLYFSHYSHTLQWSQSLLLNLFFLHHWYMKSFGHMVTQWAYFDFVGFFCVDFDLIFLWVICSFMMVVVGVGFCYSSSVGSWWWKWGFSWWWWVSLWVCYCGNGFLLWVRFMVVVEGCRGGGVGFTIGLRCWLVFSGLFGFLLLGVLGLFMVVQMIYVLGFISVLG